jgi:hypothetical protein
MNKTDIIRALNRKHLPIVRPARSQAETYAIKKAARLKALGA